MTIQEQCGAKWIVREAGFRGLWVALVAGVSQAKPGVLGFYANNLNKAAEQLSN
jgi:hypothetical protein